MKLIVAPTNFSTNSMNAAIYAADMALAMKAGLSIIHVYKIPVSAAEIAVQPNGIKKIISDAEEKMNELKKIIAARTNREVTISSELIEGSVTQTIEAFCNSVNTYAIVMGSESGNSFERFLFGGRTIASMKKSNWPIFIVPPGARFEGFRKVGFACDFKEIFNNETVDEIRNIVTTFHAELHILFVSHKSSLLFDAYINEQSGWMRKMFEGLDPKYDFIKSEMVDEKIIAYAQRNDLDLLIIVPQNHDLLFKIFKHSHARRIVLHANTPIMSIHEP